MKSKDRALLAPAHSGVENAQMKILCISGPTATGKTQLALQLGEALLRESARLSEQWSGVDILSADSRQVYKGLEIVTGADQPEGWQSRTVQGTVGYQAAQLRHFASPDGKWRLFGQSVIEADEEWSVAHFLGLAESVLPQAAAEQRLVIVVGGTALYIQQLLSPAQTVFIPRNEDLRQELEPLNLTGLQERLQLVDAARLAEMNNSDRQNPRRLLRAIEVAEWQSRQKAAAPDLSVHLPKLPVLEALEFVLTLPLERLEGKIQDRVRKRLETGALEEYRLLSKQNLDLSSPALSSTGLSYLASFEKGEGDREQVSALWTLQELQYAKRQLTWWKKHEGMVWLAADHPQLLERALEKATAFLEG